MRTIGTNFFFLVLGRALLAQPTLTAGQYTMQWGDHYELMQFNGPLSPTSGANVTWNYANLASAPLLNKDVVDPSTAGGFALFTTATAALQWLPTTEFHRSTAAQEDFLGYYISSTEYGTCSDPRTEIQYPFTFGSSFTDSLTCSENGPSPRVRTGVFTVTCTAYGTLVLPNATYADCLLLHRSWSYTDVYDGNPDPGYSDGDTYFIVSAGIGQPLLSYTTSTYAQGGGSISNTSGFWLGDFTTDVQPLTTNGTQCAYPNPATCTLTVPTSGLGNTRFTLHASDGRELLRDRSTTGSTLHVLSVEAVPPGTYLLRVEEGYSTRTLKVVKM